jgi:hypothetical protein
MPTGVWLTIRCSMMPTPAADTSLRVSPPGACQRDLHRAYDGKTVQRMR